MTKKLILPHDLHLIKDLKAGDLCLISGTIYTARDAAHKKIFDILKSGKTLPFNLAEAAFYYCGPCPAPENLAIGSCGPTTSSRVDSYTPLILDNKLKVMIGKGPRNNQVIDSIKKNKAVYFAAIGGCGALYASCVKKSVVVAFPELLSEAIHKLTVIDFPVVTAIDFHGGNIYKT